MAHTAHQIKSIKELSVRTNTKNDTTRNRTFVARNLQTLEQRNFKASTDVVVMLRPSERHAIFDRIVVKRTATPEAEAANHGVPRSLILHVLHVEHLARERAAERRGEARGKREALVAQKVVPMRPTPPSGGPSMPMRRAA